jgi:hypothetical protein
LRDALGYHDRRHVGRDRRNVGQDRRFDPAQVEIAMKEPRGILPGAIPSVSIVKDGGYCGEESATILRSIGGFDAGHWCLVDLPYTMQCRQQ